MPKGDGTGPPKGSAGRGGGKGRRPSRVLARRKRCLSQSRKKSTL